MIDWLWNLGLEDQALDDLGLRYIVPSSFALNLHVLLIIERSWKLVHYHQLSKQHQSFMQGRDNQLLRKMPETQLRASTKEISWRGSTSPLGSLSRAFCRNTLSCRELKWVPFKGWGLPPPPIQRPPAGVSLLGHYDALQYELYTAGILSSIYCTYADTL